MYPWQGPIESSSARERVNITAHPYAMARSLSPVMEKRVSTATSSSDLSTLSGRPVERVPPNAAVRSNAELVMGKTFRFHQPSLSR